MCVCVCVSHLSFSSVWEAEQRKTTSCSNGRKGSKKSETGFMASKKLHMRHSFGSTSLEL